MSVINWLTIAISLASITISCMTMYRLKKPIHEARQRFRVEYDGWTLPWWMCWTYWVGLERLAPKCFRLRSLRVGEAETA